MKKYDAIVVLGYSFDENWKLPDHLVKRLSLASDHYHKGVANKIIVTGYHSIHWDWENIDVPVRECDLMKTILMDDGVPGADIIQETKSKDTPGNIYYLKKDTLIPLEYKSILLMCATHHLKRVKFLVDKILGSEYEVDFESTVSPGTNNIDFIKHENRILAEQQEWLKDMTDGDHDWLKGKFYSDEYYLEQVDSERRARDMHATINLANK